MTSEELSRIREIYEQALPMTVSARETYLDRECPGHDGIRQEVERLLKARDNVPTWLEPASRESHIAQGAHSIDESYEETPDSYKGPQWAALILQALTMVN